MSEQPGFKPISPATSLPLKLSSAIITADDSSRSHDVGIERRWPRELSISVRVLGELEVMLATSHEAPQATSGLPEASRAAEQLELQVNSIFLSSLPRVIHVSGRHHGAHLDEAATQSYRLTMTFSDGSATSMFWSTTFEVPPTPLHESRWRLNVPFSHSLTPATFDAAPHR
ncbi:hypothetical protein ACQPXB_20315 [Amycolatopsis sp. CA-161197]|uniref:hypothetical protein n=1 Tax=unclassified Amycolatopsis TaxID=2618356 RepID=UPI0036848F38